MSHLLVFCDCLLYLTHSRNPRDGLSLINLHVEVEQEPLPLCKNPAAKNDKKIQRKNTSHTKQAKNILRKKQILPSSDDGSDTDSDGIEIESKPQTKIKQKRRRRRRRNNNNRGRRRISKKNKTNHNNHIDTSSSEEEIDISSSEEESDILPSVQRLRRSKRIRQRTKISNSNQNAPKNKQTTKRVDTSDDNDASSDTSDDNDEIDTNDENDDIDTSEDQLILPAEWRTASNSTLNIRVRWNWKKETIINKVTSIHNISMDDLVEKIHNPYFNTNYQVETMTNREILQVFHYCICPQCADDGCQNPCAECARWYCTKCVGNKPDDWICHDCSK